MSFCFKIKTPSRFNGFYRNPAGLPSFTPARVAPTSVAPTPTRVAPARVTALPPPAGLPPPIAGIVHLYASSSLSMKGPAKVLH